MTRIRADRGAGVPRGAVLIGWAALCSMTACAGAEGRPSAGEADPPSGDPPVLHLGVLPLEAGEGVDDEMLRGLAAELLAHLSHHPGVFARSLNSRPRPDDGYPPHFVARVVVDEGQDGLRVRTELEDRSERHLVLPELRVSREELTEVPVEVARQLALSMGRPLPPEALERIRRATTQDTELYGIFLKALGARGGGGSGSSGDSGVGALEDIVARDPRFAGGHAALGHLHLARGQAEASTRVDAYARAEAAFLRALEIEPALPSAVSGLVNLYSRTPNQEKAARTVRQALPTLPGRPDLHSRLGYVLRYGGLFDESIAAYERALELDPRPGNLVEWEGQIAKSLIYMGDHARALEVQEGLHRHLAEMGIPPDEKILFYQGVMHLYLGQETEAVRWFDASWATDSTTVWSRFARAYRAAATGDRERLLGLARALDHDDVADGERHYRLVHLYALAGDGEAAVQRLLVSLEAGFFAYPYISTDPLTVSLHDRADFQEALDRVAARHMALRYDWPVPLEGPRRDESVSLDRALIETVVRIPVVPLHGAGEGDIRWMVGTTYKPAGGGPFPLVVLNHGSPSDAEGRERMGRFRRLPRIEALVDRGFGVLVPMRRGFGDSGGEFAERVGPCEDPDFHRAGLEAAQDVLAAIELGRTLPWVDSQRVILLGQSAGGFAVLTAAAGNPPGVVAGMNMSGGRAGRGGRFNGESCAPHRMEATIAGFARTIRIPILWHYAENDQYFGPHHVTRWHEAFAGAGASGTLVMRPPFGEDGHGMFASPDGLHLWTGALDDFLAEIGFEGGPAPGR